MKQGIEVVGKDGHVWITVFIDDGPEGVMRIGILPENAVELSSMIDDAVGKLMQRDIEVTPDSAGAMQ